MSFPGQSLQRCWHLVDANKQTVGRLASQIATILRGKHKPTFKPHQDMGDVVVVINAEKVHFSGNKWKKKLYRWHTGYPGGLKERTAEAMLERRPTEILRRAVKGMLLSKGKRLRHGYIEPRLKIYEGPTHPHTAQLPDTVTPLPVIERNQQAKDPMGGGAYAHPDSYQASVPPPEKKWY